MDFCFGKNEQALFDLLITIPPNMNAAKAFLDTASLTAAEVTRVAIEYVDACYCEASDFMYEEPFSYPMDIIPNLHSTYIYDVVNLLLQYGLEPNGVYDGCNIMYYLKYVDNELLAADTLALLLDHGGNPNLDIDGECLFECIDFDVFFDSLEQYCRQQYAALVHFWMVLIGYGARYREDDVIQVFKEYDSSEYFDLEKLKNHRNFYFGLTHHDDGYAISICDRTTLWEVARIK